MPNDLDTEYADVMADYRAYLSDKDRDNFEGFGDSDEAKTLIGDMATLLKKYHDIIEEINRV